MIVQRLSFILPVVAGTFGCSRTPAPTVEVPNDRPDEQATVEPAATLRAVSEHSGARDKISGGSGQKKATDSEGIISWTFAKLPARQECVETSIQAIEVEARPCQIAEEIDHMIADLLYKNNSGFAAAVQETVGCTTGPDSGGGLWAQRVECRVSVATPRFLSVACETLEYMGNGPPIVYFTPFNLVISNGQVRLLDESTLCRGEGDSAVQKIWAAIGERLAAMGSDTAREWAEYRGSKWFVDSLVFWVARSGLTFYVHSWEALSDVGAPHTVTLPFAVLENTLGRCEAYSLMVEAARSAQLLRSVP